MPTKRLLLAVYAATAVLGAALAVVIFAFNGAAGDAAAKQTKKVAAAIRRGDPALAPAGAAGYVRGVRRVYGPVASVRVLRVRNASVVERDSLGVTGHHDQQRADVLVRGRRGAAVLQVWFGTGSLDPKKQPVESIHELKPGEIHDGEVDGATERAIAAGIRARGGVASAAALGTAS